MKKDTKSATGSLFNFSNQATTGASGLFANTNGGASSQFGGNSTFKFQPATTTAAGASSVFSGGSLFGGPCLGAAPGSLFGGGSFFSQTGNSTGGLFVAAGGQPSSTLFSNTAPLFGGFNALHAAPKKAEGDEDEDSGDDEAQQADDEPPAFAGDVQTTNLIPGVTDRPVKLNIVSKPPEKSPYTKVFNVSHHIYNFLAHR